MGQTTVKMLMTGFAHCEAGLFSTLQCGKERLFIQEPPLNALSVHRSCIPGGVYNVVNVPISFKEAAWCVTNVPKRNAITFGKKLNKDEEFNQLIVGTRLGLDTNGWCVGETDAGLITFNKWLAGVHEFRLYIDRVFPQIPTTLKQGDS